MVWTPRAGLRWDPSRRWILGILNLTPDSFSDGGDLPTVAAAVEAARAMVVQGADGLDIGGESTRPGAARIPADEQIRRVVPAIAAVRAALPGVVLSIDTTLAAVAGAALDAGADVINDVSGGREDASILSLAAERRAGLILMHRLRPPEQDVYSTSYGSGAAPQPVAGDVAGTVRVELAAMFSAATAAGVLPEAILLDPGLGFGKTVSQNLGLIEATAAIQSLGRPILSALSRKSFVAAVSGLPPESAPRDRAAGTLALTVLHDLRGARFFRVHEVGPCRQALNVAQGLAGA